MDQAPAETQITLRLPGDLKAFLASEARKNRSSQNSEIVRAVRERMLRASSEEDTAREADAQRAVA